MPSKEFESLDFSENPDDQHRPTIATYLGANAVGLYALGIAFGQLGFDSAQAALFNVAAVPTIASVVLHILSKKPDH